MQMRIAAVAVSAVLLAACAGKDRGAEPYTAKDVALNAPTPAQMEKAELADLGAAELRVRLNQDIGPGLISEKGTFSARLMSPVLSSRGRVIIPVGSLVHGHVVHVDDASRRVEIAFDRLETRNASYWLRANVIDAHPYALTVRPEGVTTTDTVVLQGQIPSSVGGGPPVPESEADESAPRGDVIVPFDAELRLKLTAPLGATK